VNQLPRQKNYLQGLIFQSLQVYDWERSVVIGVENNIQQVRALILRGQFELASKLIAKAKKIALEDESFLEAIKLLKFETYLYVRSGKDKEYDVQRLNYAERYSLSEKENNFDRVQELEAQVITFTRNSYSKNASLKSKLLSDDYPLLSVKAKTTFYNTLAIYYNFIRDYEKQYVYAKEYIKLKKQEYIRLEGISHFLSGYINFFYACYANKRYKECNDIINELLAYPEKNEREKQRRDHTCFILKTYLFIVTGKFEQALSYIKTTTDNRVEKESIVTRRMELEAKKNEMVIYFASGQYKNCLKFVDPLLSTYAKEYVGPAYYQCILMNILTHYELDNKETTEHLIVSARRTLKNNNKLGSLETIMLSFFKKALTKEAGKELIAETISALQKVKDEEDYHSHSSIYSFCLSWLESKLNKKSLPETIGEKAKKESGKNYWN